MDTYQALIVIVVGYVLGSLPFAVWVARFHGVDIFQVGSGNPGATNVKRSVGSMAGNIVFLLDMLKGFVAALWPLVVFSESDVAVRLALMGLVASIIGHSYSLFMKFRGGKGVATTIGGLFAVMPYVVLSGIVVWLIVFYSSRYVSLASIMFGASLPVSALMLGLGNVELVFTFLLGIFIIIRHRGNIKRLLAGTENRFTRGDDKK